MKKQAAASRVLQLPGDHTAWRTMDGYMPQKILSQKVVVKGSFSKQLSSLRYNKENLRGLVFKRETMTR